MSNIPISGYSSISNSIPTHGFGADLSVSVPDCGDISGGTNFIVSSVPIDNSAYTDSFVSSLDTVKWQDISSDGGSISISNGIILSIPTSGVAGIRSKFTSVNCDISISYRHNYDISIMPANDITFCELGLYVDTNNYIKIFHGWQADIGKLIISAVVVSDGTIMSSNTVVTTTKSSMLRIARRRGLIYMYASGLQLFTYNGWTSSAAYLHIKSVSTNTVPKPISVTVDNYSPNMLMMLGDNIATNVRAGLSGELLGTSPQVLSPGYYDINIFTINSAHIVTNGFRYYIESKLIISEDQSISICDDKNLRDI